MSNMQDVIDRAVEIATNAALRGRPVERVVWIPPTSAASDPKGVFAIKLQEPKTSALL